MNSKKDEKHLDELIRRAINTDKPRFDAEEWKQKYPEEYKVLLSRKAQASTPSVKWADILKTPIVKLAVAAVVIVMFSFFLNRDKVARIDYVTKPVEESQLPTQMISMMSMRLTYQQGGFDALDQQFRETLDVMGPRSSGVSMKELLEGINGS